MKNEKQWFALDSFEDQSPALVAMCAVYKMEGLGRWIKLMMMLRAEEGYRYNLTEKYAYKVLASRLMTSEAKVKVFIGELVHTYGLLQTDEEHIWSPWLNERMERMEERKRVLSERGKKGAKSLHAKRTAQACLDDGTSTELPCKEMTHNITQHNITEHNKTEDDDDNPKPLNEQSNTGNNKTVKQEEDTNTTLNNPPYEPVQAVLPAAAAKPKPTFEEHRTAALADERFLYPLVSGTRITTQQVAQWLTVFNRKLHYENAEAKDVQDYRRHFLSWLKFQDTTTPNPEALPLVPPTPPKPPPPAGNPAYIKTPAQVHAEQQQQLDDLRNRAAAYARSKGIDPAQAKPLRPRK